MAKKEGVESAEHCVCVSPARAGFETDPYSCAVCGGLAGSPSCPTPSTLLSLTASSLPPFLPRCPFFLSHAEVPSRRPSAAPPTAMAFSPLGVCSRSSTRPGTVLEDTSAHPP